MKTLAKLVTFFTVLAAPPAAFSWDVTGHQAIAQIAQSRLSPQATVIVTRLLAQEPGSTLVNIASWADEHRDSTNTRWHYVNFPRDSCHYVAERDCPDGECVVAKIETMNATLHSGASDATKLAALKFLVHLVGDIHQPLHAGYGDDRGGNLYQIHYLDEGKNLHAFWDTDMVEQFHRNPQQLASLVAAEQASAIESIHLDGGAAAWAEQSCNIVAAPGFYPPHQVSANYLQIYAPVAQLQMLRAGVRLADLLNTLH